MYQFLLKYCTKTTIYLGLLFIVFINLVAFPLFPKLLFDYSIPIGDVLDLQFGFSAEYAHKLLNDIGNNGRKIYLFSTLFIDTPYAIIYGFIYSFILIALLRKKNITNYNVIIYIPFLISIFDCFENAGIILLLKCFPDNCNLIIQLTSIANQGKWIFALITILLFFIILFQKNKLNNMQKSNKANTIANN